MTPQFKVGDLVRITDCRFNGDVFGDIGIIVDINPLDRVEFGEDEFIVLIEDNTRKMIRDEFEFIS